MTRLGIGSATVEIRGSSRIGALVAEELTHNGAHTDGAPDLRINIRERAGDFKGASALKGSRLFVRHEVAVSGSALSLRLGLKLGPSLYRVDLSSHPYGDVPVDVDVQVPFTSELPDLLARPFTRVGTRDFLTLHELVAKNLLYEVLEPLLWCKLLRSGATLAHAGAATAPDGGGVLFFGSGGVGKSTATLSLALRSGWSYLSDDLAVIEPGPRIVRYPKKLQVYAYNTALVEGLEERLLAGRPPMDRALWAGRRRLLGPKQARRRIHAADLLGADRIAASAPLVAAIWLTPTKKETTLAFEPMDRTTAALILGRSLIEEFWDYLRLLHAASILEPSFPSATDLHERTTEVAEAILPDEGCYRLSVPSETPGRAIASAVEAKLG